MSATTNKLVASLRKYIIPTGVVAASILQEQQSFFTLGTTSAPPAVTTAAFPLDDNSVAPITAMDKAQWSQARSPRHPRGRQHPQSPQKPRRDLRRASRAPTTRTCRPASSSSSSATVAAVRAPQQPELQHGIGSGVIISPTATSSPTTTYARRCHSDQGPFAQRPPRPQRTRSS